MRLTPEDLKKIRYTDTGAKRKHQEMLHALADSFGIDEDLIKEPFIRERLERVLMERQAWPSGDTTIPPPPEPPGIDIENFRKGERMSAPIHESFLFQLREGLIDIVGKPGMAFTLERITGPQGEDLVKVVDKINMPGLLAVKFLERHLTHLGISLVGSTGSVHETAGHITVQIALASPVRLQPEILKVTADQACPAPELTLYCPKTRTCGYQISVKDTRAPEVLARGCPRCEEKELRYELCYADGRSTNANRGDRSIKDHVQLTWDKAPSQPEPEVIVRRTSTDWPGDVLDGTTWSTQVAPPARTTGELNQDGTWKMKKGRNRCLPTI